MSEEQWRTVTQKYTMPTEINTTKYSNTPDHYLNTSGDLYDLFIKRYGREMWFQHVKMECIQYLERALTKGQFKGDIQKVITICQRILKEYGD